MALNRRHFMQVAGSAVGGAFAATTFGSLEAQAAAQKITGVTYLPQSYKALSYGSNGFVDFLKKNAKDTVDIDFYDSGKLLKADEQLPALRSGAIDFMFHTTSYVTRSIPILGITGLPGIVESLHKHPERLSKDSPLVALINEQLDKEDLVMLSAGGGILEPEYIWSTKDSPVKSIADVKGKKVRVVSFEATSVMKSFGAAAVRIPSSELYLAMQRGTVDAAVANISTIIGRSLQEQTGVVYKLPLTAYGIGIFVEKKRWANMDKAVKASIQDAADWFDAENAKTSNQEIYPNEYWPKVKAAGIEIIEPSEADLAQLEKASEDVISEWKSQVGEEVGTKAIDLALGR